MLRLLQFPGGWLHSWFSMLVSGIGSDFVRSSPETGICRRGVPSWLALVWSVVAYGDWGWRVSCSWQGVKNVEMVTRWGSRVHAIHSRMAMVRGCGDRFCREVERLGRSSWRKGEQERDGDECSSGGRWWVQAGRWWSSSGSKRCSGRGRLGVAVDMVFECVVMVGPLMRLVWELR